MTATDRSGYSHWYREACLVVVVVADVVVVVVVFVVVVVVVLFILILLLLLPRSGELGGFVGLIVEGCTNVQNSGTLSLNV